MPAIRVFHFCFCLCCDLRREAMPEETRGGPFVLRKSAIVSDGIGRTRLIFAEA
jgi:hypothetical protein